MLIVINTSVTKINIFVTYINHIWKNGLFNEILLIRTSLIIHVIKSQFENYLS